MPESSFTVPDRVTFEQAIALTQSLLSQIEGQALSESEVEAAITALVSSENGARGFFVTYLTDDRPFSDRPTPATIRALQSSPDVVAELLVKNLVMSAAMAIAHRRRQDETMAAGSDRVRDRSSRLIKHLNLPEIQERAQLLSSSLRTGTGAYQAFLTRWDYDTEQKQAMEQALRSVDLA